MAVHFDATPYTPLLSQFPQNQHRAKRSRRSSFHVAHIYTKYVSRQVTLVWKRITTSTRKPERASRLLPDGFVLINANRRRSVFFG